MKKLISITNITVTTSTSGVAHSKQHSHQEVKELTKSITEEEGALESCQGNKDLRVQREGTLMKMNPVPASTSSLGVCVDSRHGENHRQEAEQPAEPAASSRGRESNCMSPSQRARSQVPGRSRVPGLAARVPLGLFPISSAGQKAAKSI